MSDCRKLQRATLRTSPASLCLRALPAIGRRQSLQSLFRLVSAKLMRHLRREGPMSIRRLARQLGRDYKSVHSETTLLIQTGLIARTAEDEVRIGWDRIVTELDLAA